MVPRVHQIDAVLVGRLVKAKCRFCINPELLVPPNFSDSVDPKMVRDNRKHGGYHCRHETILFRRAAAIFLRVTLTVLTALLETASLVNRSIGDENQITIADLEVAGGPNIARCDEHLSYKIR